MPAQLVAQQESKRATGPWSPASRPPPLKVAAPPLPFRPLSLLHATGMRSVFLPGEGQAELS